MKRAAIAFVLAAALAVAAPILAGAKPKTKRATLRSNGTEVTDRSDEPTISANGRFIAFISESDDLAGDDDNGDFDVFVHDRKTRKTRLVSVTSADEGQDGSSSVPSISANGRWIAFRSAASLVASDDNGNDDIYVRDRKTGKTKRISVRSNGAQADDDSDEPAISANGRFVAFSTYASLVGSDTEAGSQDIYVYDRKTRKTRRVSLNSAEEPTEQADDNQTPSISAQGRFVTWQSDADNLVPNDENSQADAFVRDLERGRTTRASLTSSEEEIDDISYPSMSANGRFVTFESDDDEIVAGDTGETDVFVRDRKLGKTRRASLGRNGKKPNAFSGYAQISPDGRYVAFCSAATNIDGAYPSDDVFVRDMKRGKTKLISVGANEGIPPGSGNCYPDISANGRWVAWVSGAVGLVPNDTNMVEDIFFRGPFG
jgi:Tol biopolymer transport system component